LIKRVDDDAPHQGLVVGDGDVVAFAHLGQQLHPVGDVDTAGRAQVGQGVMRRVFQHIVH
jgi:histidine ammonia-lyase